jgi:hypothetical protein
MFQNTSGLALVTAMAGASGYAAPAVAVGRDDEADRARAGADIRNARVELYCDHAPQAIAAIRRATHTLEAGAHVADPQALAALDEAAWQARHDHTGEAVAALDTAITRLGA